MIKSDIQESTRLGEYGNGEWVTQVAVIKEGKFTRSGVQEVDEIEIFEGDENTLMMTQTYTLEFQCEYHLQKYPFDTQVKHCTLNHLRYFRVHMTMTMMITLITMLTMITMMITMMILSTIFTQVWIPVLLLVLPSSLLITDVVVGDQVRVAPVGVHTVHDV